MTEHAYDNAFMRYAAQSSSYGANAIVSRLMPALGVTSVLDVGCAAGTWLKVWTEQGVADIRGVDGDYVDRALLEIPSERFKVHNLTRPFEFGRRFDLVQCLEVAEHLPPETSAELISTLTQHADRYVLFSAAPPGQGGEFHINEQTYEFWRHEFEKHGFKPYDFVRPPIVADQAISFWYRYNIVLYVRDTASQGLPPEVAATAVAGDHPIADVSPPLFKLRKAVVGALPASVQHRLARAKAQVFGHGPDNPAAKAVALASAASAATTRHACSLLDRLFGAAGFSRPSNPWRQIWSTVVEHFRLDLPIGIIAALYLALFLPIVGRNSANPQLDAAFVNDEPYLVMALEATTVRPWGNPGNYFDLRRKSSEQIPAHWGHMRYGNIFYYGGSLYQIAFPFQAAARIIGLPPFPSALIILRTICMLAGLGAMIVLYNIFKARGSRLAGGTAAGLLMTDGGFNYYVTYVHHDSLQVLFGLLAFVFAARHARRGDWASLAGLGIFCGLVQGTKVGAPWLAPMAALAVAFGLYYAQGAAPLLGATTASATIAITRFLARGSVLASVGILAFFVSTPYAAVDSYYWRSLLATLADVSQSRVGQDPSLGSWITTFKSHLGFWLWALAGLGAMRALWSFRRRPPDLALVLALVLACSQVLWFGLVGKLWHMISYLLVAQALLSGVAMETVVVMARRARALMTDLIPPVAPWARIASAVAAVVTVIAVFGERWDTPVRYAMQLLQTNTVVALGDWAADGGVPRDASILHDDLAYFDAAKFPKARMHGGVLTWPQVEVARPDVVVLSSSLYGADWYVKLRAKQAYDRWNPDPLSMRLYQDLLQAETPGPTGVPGVELLKIWKPQPDDRPARTVASAMEAFAWAPAWARSSIARMASIVGTLRSISAPPPAAAVGPELRVFRLAPAESQGGRPASFATGSADGYPSTFAFDSTLRPWRCSATGTAAKSCTIGFDFGSGATVAVRKVRIHWEGTASKPDAFWVQHSDDGKDWTTASEHRETNGEVADIEGKADLFAVPNQGGHRYWRIVPKEMREGASFAIAEMGFLDQP